MKTRTSTRATSQTRTRTLLLQIRQSRFVSHEDDGVQGEGSHECRGKPTEEDGDPVVAVEFGDAVKDAWGEREGGRVGRDGGELEVGRGWYGMDGR